MLQMARQASERFCLSIVKLKVIYQLLLTVVGFINLIEDSKVGPVIGLHNTIQFLDAIASLLFPGSIRIALYH